MYSFSSLGVLGVLGVLGGLCFQDTQIVSFQAKQTELSTSIINKQKINLPPAKELPNYFEYPPFVLAFDSFISSNVPSDRDQVYFLDKNTTEKANNVDKGFVDMSSDSANKRAQKLLDHRFGNPVHVAYKSTLRKWPRLMKETVVVSRNFRISSCTVKKR